MRGGANPAASGRSRPRTCGTYPGTCAGTATAYHPTALPTVAPYTLSVPEQLPVTRLTPLPRAARAPGRAPGLGFRVEGLVGRRWSSNPSGKCSYERPTRGTVCGTMRSMCGADAGCLAINYQSLGVGGDLGLTWSRVQGLGLGLGFTWSRG